MSVSDRAGIIGSDFDLVDIPRLVSDYYEKDFVKEDKSCHISFGTSGHRGSSFDGVFLRCHIQALTQALVILRRKWGYSGPVFLGRDTHALSYPAFKTVIEVLCANNVDVVIDKSLSYTPTPVISHMIVRHNALNQNLSDGIILTPSHNPPDDGGFKYNPAYGGPSVKAFTREIEALANEILLNDNTLVKTMSFEKAMAGTNVHYIDMLSLYLEAIGNMIDFKAIRAGGIRIGVHPQGGSALHYFEAIAERHRLNLEIIDSTIDPTFQFMPYDYNDKIRMDCISPYTMKVLTESSCDYDIGIATDPDSDRHGIATRGGVLLKSASYLSILLHYLLKSRERWQKNLYVGKNIGSSALIDSIASSMGYKVYETAIGFKWVSELLYQEKLVFGCEDSAGASFLDLNGHVVSSDKDGITSSLMACEIMAKENCDLNDYLHQLNRCYGSFFYGREDVIITKEQKDAFKALSADRIDVQSIASSKVVKKFDSLHGQSLGGIKVVLKDGFFAARPSGTENIYKIYYESKQSARHAQEILEEARGIIAGATGL